jgi:hypothetical protein
MPTFAQKNILLCLFRIPGPAIFNNESLTR